MWFIAIASSKLSTDGHKYGPFKDHSACLDWLDRNPNLRDGYLTVIFFDRQEKPRPKGGNKSV